MIGQYGRIEAEQQREGRARRPRPLVPHAGTTVTVTGGKAPVKRRSMVPTTKTLAKWTREGYCRATDGCKVEPDGQCYHGKRSWLLALGLI